LGIPNILVLSTPTIIPILNNIKQIAAGGHFSIALDKNGNIFSFGRNEVNYK
jgi:alpha-tubulin suppressor-like RCC1 family protein